MMNDLNKISFEQYKKIPEILKKPYDSDDALMVSNHILDRDSFLSDIEGIQKELKIADNNLKKALQNTSSQWKEKIVEAIDVCDIKSEWWQNIISSI